MSGFYAVTTAPVPDPAPVATDSRLQFPIQSNQPLAATYWRKSLAIDWRRKPGDVAP